VGRCGRDDRDESLEPFDRSESARAGAALVRRAFSCEGGERIQALAEAGEA